MSGQGLNHLRNLITAMKKTISSLIMDWRFFEISVFSIGVLVLSLEVF